MVPEPRCYTADEIRVGLRAEFTRDVTPEDVRAFAANSGDFNPLHIDPDYAAGSTYGGCIAHGAFQVGLASALAGMHLPGRHVLLGALSARFASPLPVPRRVLVRGEITAWNREVRAGQLRVVVLDAAARVPYSEIAVSFTLHGAREPGAAGAPARRPAAGGAGRTVLVTGAAGGIGREIVATLAPDYQILALVNRRPLDAGLAALPGVRCVTGDLAAPGWEPAVGEALGGRGLYGVAHAAWPGAPRGGLLDGPDDAAEQQLAFGTVHVVRLARLLFARVGPEGGRLVVLGSTYGTSRPNLAAAAYSLGKAALEHTVRLLAPELARRQVTVNAVCPSYVPVGLNEHADEKHRNREAARVPLGRLCSAADVASSVRYLLAPEASFISGQSLGLTGGQL